MLFEFQSNMAGIVRTEILEDEPHFVCPVIMMTEGVHNGSGGPILYTAIALAAFPDAWNSKPVVVRHPLKNGSPTSAGSPDVHNTTKIGVLFNTRFEDGKLKADAWINKARLEEVSPEAFADLSAGVVMEVSTGLFFEKNAEPGIWNEEAYDAVACNLRPDHLAILPDEVGACSVADGAGMPRINVATRSMKYRIRHLAHLAHFTDNAQSFYEITDRLHAALEVEVASSIPEMYVWIDDVYGDRVVYSYSSAPGRFFQRGYSVSDPVSVTLADKTTEVEVKRTVDYVTSAAADTEHEETITMEQDVKTEFEGLGKRLDDVLTAVNTSEEVVASEATEPTTLAEVIAGAPDHLKASLQEGLDAVNAEKVGIIETLMAHENAPYTKPELEAMPLDSLRKLNTLAAKPVETPTPTAPVGDFSAQAAAPAAPVGGAEVEVMLSPDTDLSADAK